MLLHSTVNSIAQSIENQPSNRRSQRSKIECQTRFDIDSGTAIGPQTAKSTTISGTKNDTEIHQNRWIFHGFGRSKPSRIHPGGPQLGQGSPQGTPRAPTRSPRSAPEAPRSTQRTPTTPPKVRQEGPKAPKTSKNGARMEPRTPPRHQKNEKSEFL